MIEFEKRYDGQSIEKQMQAFWEENHIYDFHPDSSRPLYSIDTPPPTVNGKLHIGHIFSYTQAEMIARYRRMQGYNVFYPFGFDDNGLPSERLVEKELGVKAKDLPRADFVAKCIQVTQKYELEFVELWKSMGFSCDWNLLYSTGSANTQRLSQQSFVELAKHGHAYLKESPVLWCSECQTSIAQAELETKELESYFHTIAFQAEGSILKIATTRPELLYGVVCVLVNPLDTRYLALIGKTAQVPLYDFAVPILADEKVAMDKGTGAVMCATYGDTTDVEWVEHYGLPYKKVILEDGTIAPDVSFISGLSVKEARKEITRLLTEKGLLLHSEKMTHMVSVHERCQTEVEIIPSKQWTIDVLSKRDELLRLGDQIAWNPPHMKSRYVSWVENLKWDWSISRQRFFGVPIPVWYCKACGKPVIADVNDLPVNPMETSYHGACECGSVEFVPDKAVFDTWATSSISPLINLDTAKRYGIADGFLPMSMRTQAHEIIRTWAFYTITKSLYHTGQIPWKDAMICGFVLAKPGEKISKSKDNATLSPGELIQTYTADALRYWAANARLGTDTFFDITEMQDSSKRLITKLWNSAKFVLSHLTDYQMSQMLQPISPSQELQSQQIQQSHQRQSPQTARQQQTLSTKDTQESHKTLLTQQLQPSCTLLPIDRWIIERTHETILETSKWLDQYEIGLARKVVDEFFWKDFCDHYIELVKERLYQPQIHGVEARRSGQTAIAYTLHTILQLYAIYIPHETEYIYQKGFRQLDGAVSIHLTQLPKPESVDADLLHFGTIIKSALAEVRRYKSEHNLSMKDEIECVTISGAEKYRSWVEETRKDLIACTHAKNMKYCSN